jgi:hypothetical protein
MCSLFDTGSRFGLALFCGLAVSSLVDAGSNFVFAYFCGWAVLFDAGTGGSHFGLAYFCGWAVWLMLVAILGWPSSADGQSG